MALKNDSDKTSYALGMDIGASFKRLPLEISLEAAIEGMCDVFNGEKPKISEQEFMALMQAFQQKLQGAAEAAKKAQGAKGEENSKAEAAFMEENKNKDGIVTTASGLQYKVLAEGSGEKPKADSMVTVHYTGTLPDGQKFDSSIDRGEPATFPVNGVIPGWTEALQLMQKGTKLQLFIPAKLAYGANGAGPLIGPNQMLIFEVELLSFK